MKRTTVYAICVAVWIVLVGIFFRQTIVSGSLPVPTDALVGLYHPWRDLYAESYPRGIPFRNFLITDPVRQQIPWRKTAIDQWKQGKLPLYDPYSFSGRPLMGNIQSGALYPLNVLFFLTPFDTAWAVLIILQPLLAGLFMFAYLQSRKLSVAASALGAVTFSFSGFSVSWLTWGTIVQTALWLPLMLLAADRIMSGTRLMVWMPVLAVAVICSLTAGHIQIFLYVLAVLVCYAGATLFARRATAAVAGKAFMRLGATGIFTALVTLPYLTRIFGFVTSSGRVGAGADAAAEGFFIPWAHLAQFLAPDFFGNPATLNYWGTWNYGELVGYVGVSGLVCALAGIFGAKSRRERFWTVLLIIAMAFAFDSPLARLPYRLQLPFVGSLQPTRLLFVMDFALSVLAAYGLDALGRAHRRFAVAAGGVAAAFALLWTYVLLTGRINADPGLLIGLGVAKRNLVLPTIAFAGVVTVMLAEMFSRRLRKIPPYAAPVLVAAIAVFELFRFGWKFTPFTPRELFFPVTETISYLEKNAGTWRVMPANDNLLPSNSAAYYGIAVPGGYDPVYDSRYEEFMAALERGKPDIARPFGFNRIVTPKRYDSPLFPFLGAKYVLSLSPLTDPHATLLMREGTTYTYAFDNALPVAYLVRNVRNVSDKQQAIRVMYDSSFIARRDAVTESAVHTDQSELGPHETVAVVSYGQGDMEFRVVTDTARLLAFSLAYDPHWTVRVDGKKTGLIRTNYAFSGVEIPGGTHTVHVSYE